MQDPFTGKPTLIRGREIPLESERNALQHHHQRRLETLARLGAAAAECGLRTDTDRDLVLLAEDEVSLLESAGEPWISLGEAIRAFRACLPLMPLEAFGFSSIVDNNPLEEPNELLRRIGGGVEAWAYVSDSDGSVYKFFLPREEKTIGSAFEFRPGEETALRADARLGHYWELLEKLRLVQALGGMPSEVVAVTPEGVLVVKQVLGDPLPQGQDVSCDLPQGLIEIPSRFLRANRDHPRLFFHDGNPWLVGDLHARNLVRGSDGKLHVIDLVAAPWPVLQSDALCREWITRVRSNAGATLLPNSPDEEL